MASKDARDEALAKADEYEQVGHNSGEAMWVRALADEVRKLRSKVRKSSKDTKKK